MRLADFITTNSEAILAEWVVFAATCGAAGDAMDRAELRDHAQEMLKQIVEDLRTPQTDAQQVEKSKGKAEPVAGAAETAAQVHGAGRAESGFTVGEMVSEYRALRASVIRLWTKQEGTLTGADLDDLMRFNEAIDQSLAESISRYTQDIDHSREMFIAILGHDLRTPIAAVMMASQFMLETGDLEEPHAALVTRIRRAGVRMNQMVGDLLDFTRSQLGAGMPIVRTETDMGTDVSNAVDEITAANPDSEIRLETSGDLRGEWDAGRTCQMLTNLLANAVHYGSPKMPITVSVRGEPNAVVLQIHNSGPPIPPENLPRLFSPFKRLHAGEPARTPSTNLGLGLYIVERIVTAHEGTIDVSSEPVTGTTFTVRLPR